MPTYVYRRKDGSTFECEQRITEDALQTCPTTGQPVTRVITGGTGLIFKGNGFYLTDYARNNGAPAETPAKNGTSSETASPSSKGDTKEPSKPVSSGKSE